MNTKKSGGEMLSSNESSGMAVAERVSQSEDFGIKGRYVVTCLEPREQDVLRYIELRDKIATHESRNFVARLLATPLMKSVRDELAAIPLEVKWVQPIDNLVTTVGKNNLLDNHLAGSAYTAAWYAGLISSTSYTTGAAVGDTSASHGGWAEDQNYTQSTRVAPSFSSASSGSKATASVMVFTMNVTTTIKGVFLISVSTKGGTTGTLFSAGLFTGGDQAVTSSSTLNVTYTLSA